MEGIYIHIPMGDIFSEDVPFVDGRGDILLEDVPLMDVVGEGRGTWWHLSEDVPLLDFLHVLIYSHAR